MSDSLLIKNAFLYSSIDNRKCYDILVHEGKIISLAPAGEITKTIRTIDASGLIAIPGLIDLHIHGAGGFDSMDGTKKALSKISCTLANLGTTAFLTTMFGKPEKKNRHLKVARQLMGKDIGGAELLGVYIEGPFLNMDKRGGINSEYIAKPSPAILEKILEEAEGAIKIMCLAPEIPGNYDIIKRLMRARIKVAFGHSDAGYIETIKGFNAGISHITHLFNAMHSMHHRNPGPLAAIFESSDITVELISDSYHVHPSLLKLTYRLISSRNIACITDGISGMGLPDGIYSYNNKQYISEGGLAKYFDGTFVGSTKSLFNIALNFMNFTGCRLKEAIDTVTINPARIIGVDNRKGSIEPEKDADIVLMTPSYKIKNTIIGGEIIL